MHSEMSTNLLLTSGGLLTEDAQKPLTCRQNLDGGQVLGRSVSSAVQPGGGERMGLSGRTRALIALALAMPAFAVSTASAATLSSDEAVPLGSRTFAPTYDDNVAGM